MYMDHAITNKTVLALCALLFSTASLAVDEINADASGLGVKGHDVVAYFKAGKALKGKPGINTKYQEVSYLFVSEENKAAFLADPEYYLPAYGGYCAYGVRMGVKLDADPGQWRIHKERLYMILDKDTFQLWDIDMSNNIDLSDSNWTRIRTIPVEELNQKLK